MPSRQLICCVNYLSRIVTHAAAPVPAPMPSDDSINTEDTLDGATPAPAPSDDYFITYASALDSASPAAATAASPGAAPAAGPLSGPLDFLSLVGTGAPMPGVGALLCCQDTGQQQLWQHTTWRPCMAGPHMRHNYLCWDCDVELEAVVLLWHL